MLQPCVGPCQKLDLSCGEDTGLSLEETLGITYSCGRVKASDLLFFSSFLLDGQGQEMLSYMLYRHGNGSNRSLQFSVHLDLGGGSNPLSNTSSHRSEV